ADDHLHVGEIRDRIERRLVKRPRAPRRHHQRGEQHQKSICDRPANEMRNHGFAPFDVSADCGCVCARPASLMRATLALRLASESIKNCPDTTTFCPACNPLLISVCPLLSTPTSTSMGTNLPSPCATMT